MSNRSRQMDLYKYDRLFGGKFVELVGASRRAKQKHIKRRAKVKQVSTADAAVYENVVSGDGVVDVITAHGDPKLVKVEVSTNVHRRVKALSTYSPVRLELVGTVPGSLRLENALAT